MRPNSHTTTILFLLLFAACPKTDNNLGTYVHDSGPDKSDASPCLYGGKTYTVGESFKDSCNTCTCDIRAGVASVACTVMACLPPPDASIDSSAASATGGSNGTGGASGTGGGTGKEAGSRPNIGAPCDDGVDAGPSQGVFNSAASECSSHLCIKPVVDPLVSAAGGTDTGSLCTATCSTDNDCDGLLRDPSNPNDKSCVSGFTCGMPFVKGSLCCQGLCVCKDFTGGPLDTPIACQGGNAATCKDGLVQSDPGQTITEFTITTDTSHPLGIVAGPDGNLWFTEYFGGNIGRITTSGSITEFPVTPGCSPVAITLGPDGNLWFTEYSSGTCAKIGRITPDGVMDEFSLPSSLSQPKSIVTGRDLNLWFTDSAGGKIGSITPDGVITEFVIPANIQMGPAGIVAGIDGNLWFATGQLGRITPTGTVTTYSLPSNQIDPSGITLGSDINFWFTDQHTTNIGRLTMAGVITEFPRTTAGSMSSYGITPGPDGNLWFTDDLANRIGRITTSGVSTEFTLPTPDSRPSGIARGADDKVWFTEATGNKIGHITP